MFINGVYTFFALLLIQNIRNGQSSDAPTVTVTQGALEGTEATSPSGVTYYSFQGIPYAEAPVGSLRFLAPQSLSSWEGTLNATTEGNKCVQIDYSANLALVGNEDCLFLNVYTPNLEGSLPVLFYIHGGSYRYGSGNDDLYGPGYFVEKEVIVVTFNYRMSAFGFLSLNTSDVPGNAALKDMAAALSWVVDNIENFGGDPSKITVFGESSGAEAASLFLVSDLTKDLISGVIMESGTSLQGSSWTLNPLEQAELLATQLGCSGDDILSCLQSANYSAIAEAVEDLNGIGTGYIEEGTISLINLFSAVKETAFDGVDAFLTEDLAHLIISGYIADVPVIVGTNGLEYAQEPKVKSLAAFVPPQFELDEDSEKVQIIADEINEFYFGDGNYNDTENWPSYYKLISDAFFNADTQRFVDYMVNISCNDVYVYKFTYVGQLNLGPILLGRTEALDQAGHTDELGYLFQVSYLDGVTPTDDDITIRDRMVTMWTNFAKYGNPTPNVTDLLPVTWLPATTDNNYYFNISTDLSVGSDPDEERMTFWETLYDNYYDIYIITVW